jgi:hypothetical protein
MGLGFLASFGLGFYNTYQINKLHSEVQLQQQEIDTVITTIREDETLIANNTANLRKLAKQTELIAEATLRVKKRVQWDEVQFQLTQQVAQFEMEVEKWSEAVASLLAGKLHPNLVSANGLRLAYAEIVRQAADKGLRPITKEWTAAYQSGVTVMRAGKGLALFIHVALVKEPEMEIYQLLHLPMLLNGTLAWFHLEEQYLALNTAKTMIKEIKDSDFRKCTMVNKVFLCPDNNVLDKNLEVSCLYGLWSQNVPQVQKVCDLRIGREKEIAIQISRNEFQILFPQATSIIYRCLKNETRQILTGIHKLLVKPGCSIITPNNLLHVAPDVQIASTNLLMQFPSFNVKHLEEMLVDSIGDDAMNAVISNIKQLNFPDVKLSNLKHMMALQLVQQKFKEADASSSMFSLGQSLWIVLKIIVIIAVGGLIGFAIFKIYRCRHPQSGLQKVKLRFSELRDKLDVMHGDVQQAEHQRAKERLEGAAL